MHAAADRPEFSPPPQPGLLRGLVLAIIAHLLLLAGLTTGLQWKREAENVSAEAELWAAVPQQAAPKVETPPPVVQAPPVVQPPPVVQAPPEPDPQVQRDAQIALEREKERREAAEKRQAELERERRRKAEAERERRREELARKREQEKLAAAEAKRKEDERKRRQQEQDAKRLAQLREENLRRIQGMAGGSGAPSATGTAAQSSGPSASWAGRVQARVRPNIVFTDDFSGNPKAEVEVRMAPDGTIVARRIIKSSGNKTWDEAVLRALDKTEVLPRDVDGRVPTPVVIEFRPKG